MKRLLALIAVIMAVVVTSCTYDDTQIWDRLDDHEDRISKLEELCREMNSNIEAMQTIVSALQTNDYITSVTPITKDGDTVGYTITFTKSSPITIYNGEDGKDGTNGADGYAPVIGVKKDSTGVYYWTIDGEWLLDADGNKIKAVGVDGANGTDGTDGADGADGKDGADGANGADGVTPTLKIENGNWYVSYDNGATWVELGKAAGEDGANGEDGDSFFQSVDTSNDDYVLFTLADGTQIKIPTWYAFEQLQILCNQLNTNIDALQTIVNALQDNDYIQSITPLMEGGKEVGYTITFTKSGTVTIYHGEDGANGQDGHTPKVGVKKDADDIYYWTIDGEWLLDADGKKIKAVGIDGENGENGANGITPTLKIENGNWYVSYDNGATWTEVGKATGEDGANGEDGDAFFMSVTKDEQNVYFTLADGTELVVPLATSSLLADLRDITFIPRYSDNKATVTRYEGDGVVVAEFDFMIAPKSMAALIAENYRDVINVKAIETTTRAITFINMPVLSCEADSENGTISIKASGVYLNPRTFDGEVNYSASIIISDGKNSVISDYVELCTYISSESSTDQDPVEPENPDSPENPDEPALPSDDKIIYYTTSDSAPVTLGATTGFGGILLSNEYDVENNIGMLTFSAKVTCIPANAFKSSKISTINIPATVTEIGDNAFWESDLSEINISNNVTKMGKGVCYNCRKLATVNIDCACDITGYNSNSSHGCFSSCDNLRVVNIGNSVTGIQGNAFSYCDNLRVVNIGNSVTGIQTCAFYSCDNLSEVTIGNKCSWIGSDAFYSNSIETITIPDSVGSIGEGAFGASKNLVSIYMGSGVKTVGYNAFNNCPKLEYLYINDLASYCGIDFNSTTSNPVPSNPIGGGTCHLYLNGNLLTELNIPEGVTEIGRGAFFNCDTITKVTIPNSVKVIDDWAFAWCDGISDIYIPGVTDKEYATTIGAYAFTSCDKLAEVVVGERVSSIGEKAFYNCAYLQKFYCKATIPPSLGTNVFYGSNGYTIGTQIFVPNESVNVYMGAINWKDYANYIVGY